MLQTNLAVSYGSQSYQTNASTITKQQSEVLGSVLANYDAKNLSDTDAEEIVSQIKELGIKEGSGLINALSEAGIDAQVLAEQAGVRGAEGSRPPPPPSGTSGTETEDSIVSLVSDAVQSFAESDDADSTWSILQASLEEAGVDTTKSFVNVYM